KAFALERRRRDRVRRREALGNVTLMAIEQHVVAHALRGARRSPRCCLLAGNLMRREHGQPPPLAGCAHSAAAGRSTIAPSWVRSSRNSICSFRVFCFLIQGASRNTFCSTALLQNGKPVVVRLRGRQPKP